MRGRPTRVAQRYARAIFSLVGEKADLRDSVLIDLKKMAHLVQSSDAVAGALMNPTFPLEKRAALVGDLVTRIHANELSKRILCVIARADRIGALSEIVVGVDRLRMQSAKLVAITVETGSELSGEEKKRIVSRFGVVLGMPVEPTFTVNAGIIGGFRAMANGKTYDGSVSGWLNNFSERGADGTSSR